MRDIERMQKLADTASRQDMKRRDERVARLEHG